MTHSRILVVDDEPGMLRSVERVLSRDYHVTATRQSRDAVEIAKAWARGEVSVGDARKAALGAHAAARDVESNSASAAARAAGHAVATAHMADHCLGASLYALILQR